MLRLPTRPRRLGFAEIAALSATLTSLIALSIDAMLPALPTIGSDLGVTRANDTQLIISMLFLGFAIGQLLYGPLSDAYGRRPMIFLGLGIFVAGCVLSMVAEAYPTMLVGRFLQGFGAAAPRIVTVAVIRDLYDGRVMARLMSVTMSLFIVVPAVAPALGQLILTVADWRWIFGMVLAMAAIGLTWAALRLPETLCEADRRPLSLRGLGDAVRMAAGNRFVAGYTIASGLVFGAFIGYLNSAQQIFQDSYGLGERFPLYFAILAGALGAASVTNAKLVLRWGMRLLSFIALMALIVVTVPFCVLLLFTEGQAPLWALMAWAWVSFFAMGMLFANFNAMAMEPLGHIAGIGAALIGFAITLVSSLLGAAIGQLYDGTILPLVGGFAVLGILSALVMIKTEGGLPRARHTAPAAE